MSDAEITPATRSEPHDTHDAGHGHESSGERLGPVDIATWGYAVAGGAIGIVVVLVMFAAGGG